MKRILSKRFQIIKYFECKNYSVHVSSIKPLEIPGLQHRDNEKTKPPIFDLFTPRWHFYSGHEEWSNLWPSAHSYNYYSVPLPIYQGHIKHSHENKGVKPGGYANAELLKIPNFLHLTPKHIEKHCNAMKKYCTKWPEELDDNSIKTHFPLEYQQSDYIHSAPSIRDIRARCVTLTFEVKSLRLNKREKFKFLKLLGEKNYNEETDIAKITADRCPSNRQNYQYLNYVLTALTKESKKFEKWEIDSEESDWIKYEYERSKHKTNLRSYCEKVKFDPEKSDIVEIEKKHKSTIESLYDDKENIELWNLYKNNMVNLLHLKTENCK